MNVVLTPMASETFTPASLSPPIRSSQSKDRNIRTPRPASVPRRTSLANACSSLTRSLRWTWWSLFTQRLRETVRKGFDG